MTEIEELKTMLTHFRVHDLQQLLIYAGRSKNGKKSELLERALALLENCPAPMKIKIRDLHNKVMASTSYYSILKNRYFFQDLNNNSNNINNNTTSTPTNINNVNTINGLPVNSQHKNSNNVFTQYFYSNNTGKSNSNDKNYNQTTNLTPLNMGNINNLNNNIFNNSLKGGITYSSQQQSYNQNSQFIVQPIIKFKSLPFYEKLSDLIKPTTLVPYNYEKTVTQETFFIFRLSPQMVNDIVSSKFKCPITQKEDYATQIQLRFCLYDMSDPKSGCDDHFPSNISVKVNGVYAPLPLPLPPKPPSTEPKRPGRPINITPLVKLSPMLDNQINISWNNSFHNANNSSPFNMNAQNGMGNNNLIMAHVMALFLVRKNTTQSLLQKLTSKSYLRATATRYMIKEKLKCGADDLEIATTSLRISLLCPLSKCRMIHACRSVTCAHFQCFDANSYLSMNEKNSKWICPVCHGPALYQSLSVDSLFMEILSSAPDFKEVEFFQDGSWRPFSEKIVKKTTKETSLDNDKQSHVSDLETDTNSGNTIRANDKPPILTCKGTLDESTNSLIINMANILNSNILIQNNKIAPSSINHVLSSSSDENLNNTSLVRIKRKKGRKVIQRKIGKNKDSITTTNTVSETTQRNNKTNSYIPSTTHINTIYSTTSSSELNENDSDYSISNSYHSSKDLSLIFYNSISGKKIITEKANDVLVKEKETDKLQSFEVIDLCSSPSSPDTSINLDKTNNSNIGKNNKTDALSLKNILSPSGNSTFNKNSIITNNFEEVNTRNIDFPCCDSPRNDLNTNITHTTLDDKTHDVVNGEFLDIFSSSISSFESIKNNLNDQANKPDPFPSIARINSSNSILKNNDANEANDKINKLTLSIPIGFEGNDYLFIEPPQNANNNILRIENTDNYKDKSGENNFKINTDNFNPPILNEEYANNLSSIQSSVITSRLTKIAGNMAYEIPHTSIPSKSLSDILQSGLTKDIGPNMNSQPHTSSDPSSTLNISNKSICIYPDTDHMDSTLSSYTSINPNSNMIEMADREIAKNIFSLMRRDSNTLQNPPDTLTTNPSIKTSSNCFIERTSGNNFTSGISVRKVDQIGAQLLLEKCGLKKSVAAKVTSSSLNLANASSSSCWDNYNLENGGDNNYRNTKSDSINYNNNRLVNAYVSGRDANYDGNNLIISNHPNLTNMIDKLPINLKPLPLIQNTMPSIALPISVSPFNNSNCSLPMLKPITGLKHTFSSHSQSVLNSNPNPNFYNTSNNPNYNLDHIVNSSHFYNNSNPYNNIFQSHNSQYMNQSNNSNTNVLRDQYCDKFDGQ
ncbi:putative uncharacterized protein DDB_G0277255 isoform X2 [Gordionus sp. m RMFG-2023]|uniref:putative uncharacterized protein DDB_G0277255 isoform X2 n=1 Tax=Gordionus sp. m RMFG-2023 TaxID=3053472 RepID=UPI0031FC6D3E